MTISGTAGAGSVVSPYLPLQASSPAKERGGAAPAEDSFTKSSGRGIPTRAEMMAAVEAPDSRSSSRRRALMASALTFAAFLAGSMTGGSAQASYVDSLAPVGDTSISTALPVATAATEARRGYHSREQEFAPVQVAGKGLPAGAQAIAWKRPSAWTSIGSFAGVPGSKASHEGVDYVHANWGVRHVPVGAAADGKVIYVRTGCPATDMRSRNKTLRECGAGWGNHVVVEHAHGIRTRYAHLAPGSITVDVGDAVKAGQIIGENGNSGRSELRHLHFELGTGGKFNPKAPAASFDRVYDSNRLPWAKGDKGPSS